MPALCSGEDVELAVTRLGLLLLPFPFSLEFRVIFPCGRVLGNCRRKEPLVALLLILERVGGWPALLFLGEILVQV
jgi:hypothetical protein